MFWKTKKQIRNLKQQSQREEQGDKNVGQAWEEGSGGIDLVAAQELAEPVVFTLGNGNHVAVTFFEHCYCFLDSKAPQQFPSPVLT